ncbi:MAG TPA: phage tail protein [Thermoanaerobaculia bacterium]|nr:phage tail protein [Thermoanaerobaculia bacterium]
MNGGDCLYELLPAIHRIRDAAAGEPLRALLRVMERELAAAEADVEVLYENWFIETCEEWVVPYVGDLLGVSNLEPVAPEVFSQRAFVANTLRYRRRKGTAAVLEQLARDLTGWSARAVEMFERLVATQHVNHPRPRSHATLGLRPAEELELLGGPFEFAAHTVEVRRVASGRGRYNVPNVGLFLWRLESYPVERGEARPVDAADPWRYRFHPVGLDAPLFAAPRTEEEITHLAEEVDVPGRLRRRPLHAELEALRRPGEEGGGAARGFFVGATAPFQVVTVAAGGVARPVPPEEVLVCDLGDRADGSWPRPPALRTYTTLDDSVEPPVEVEVGRPVAVAVDPVLGRLALPEPEPGEALPERVEVSYRYVFSGDVGGGPYDRRRSVEASLPRQVDWQLAVSRREAPIPGERVATLAEAVAAWNDRPAGTVGVIAVTDSASYEEELTADATLEVPEGSTLLLVAAGWPESAAGVRRPGDMRPDRLRPHLVGDVSVRGTAPEDSERPGTLVVDGLLVEGRLRVLSGHLGSLVLSHTTLVPGEGGLLAAAGAESNDRLEIAVRRSLVGRIDLGETGIGLEATDSLVDPAGEEVAIQAPESAVTVAGVTLLGELDARRLDADDSLFTAVVRVLRRQEGCLRFSYVPEGSRTPRRYRCQPDLEIERRTGAAARRAAEAGGKLSAEEQDAIQERAVAEIVPAFTSLRYSDPAYGQLARATPGALRAGAEDGSEMGAFRHLQQPRREANLRRTLSEYLPFGLEAGIFFVT